MKICPIAIAVGCPRCALFKVCPAKKALGGYTGTPAKEGSAPPKAAARK